MKLETIKAGRIVGTHGVRGEVRVQPRDGDPAFLTRFKKRGKSWSAFGDTLFTPFFLRIGVFLLHSHLPYLGIFTF